MHSAKGKAVIDRGTRTIELTVTAGTAEGLPAVTTEVDSICAHLAHATQNTSVATRTTLHLSRDSGHRHYVHRPPTIAPCGTTAAPTDKR